jgi:O-antigen ligase
VGKQERCTDIGGQAGRKITAATPDQGWLGRLVVVLILFLSALNGYFVALAEGSVVPVYLVVAEISFALALLILKRPILGFYSVVFSLPVLRTASVPGIGPRPAISDALFVLSFVSFWLGQAWNERQVGVRLHPSIRVPFGLFLVATMVSAFSSRAAAATLVEIVIYVYLFAFYVTFERVIQSVDALKSMLKVWIYSMIMVSGISVLSMLGISFGFPWLYADNMTHRLTSTFKNPNQLSSFLVPSIFVVLGWASSSVARLSRSIRVGLVFLALVMVIAMVFTASLAGFVGFIVASVLFCLMHLGGRNGTALLLGTALPSIAAGTAAFLYRWVDPPYPFDFYGWRARRFISMLEVGPSAVPFAESNWKGLLQAWLRSPLFGVGTGSFFSVAGEFGAEEGYEPHNTYLGILGETGLVGFIPFTWIVLVVLRSLISSVRRLRDEFWRSIAVGLLAGVIGLLVIYWGHYGFRMRHFWFIVVIALAIERVVMINRGRVGGRE